MLTQAQIRDEVTQRIFEATSSLGDRLPPSGGSASDEIVFRKASDSCRISVQFVSDSCPEIGGNGSDGWAEPGMVP